MDSRLHFGALGTSFGGSLLTSFSGLRFGHNFHQFWVDFGGLWGGILGTSSETVDFLIFSTPPVRKPDFSGPEGIYFGVFFGTFSEPPPEDPPGSIF